MAAAVAAPRRASGPQRSRDPKPEIDSTPDEGGGILVERVPGSLAAQGSAADELISGMLARFRSVESIESETRREMLEDLDFFNGKQWPADILQRREAAGRPALTINRLPQFIRQVVNQARSAKPSPQINPQDSGSDPDTAEVLQDICRNIETRSDADVAYERAIEHQTQMGRGFVGVTTEYDSDEGFALALKIRSFRNPMRVYFDPSATEADGKDAEFCIITEDLDRKTFRRRFKGASQHSLDVLETEGNLPIGWADEQKIRIAEYWYKTYVKETLVECEMLAASTGQLMTITLPRHVIDQNEALRNPEILAKIQFKELRERDVARAQVRVALLSGSEILEGNADKTAGREWPGKYIPIVPVYGDESEHEGRVKYTGMVRHAKDAQRMYNYWGSALTEAIALAPRAPWVAAVGQLKGFEEIWKTANQNNPSVLYYKEVSAGGKFHPPPFRRVEEPPIQAIVVALQQADNDLKAVMGLYDASLGQQGPQESGKAILTRQRQGEIANSNFADNRARAVRQIGRILVDLIPKVYDVATVLRIRGEDGKARDVTVYSHPNPDVPEGVPNLRALQESEKVQGIYNLGVGRYDVSVSVGPSFQSRRQEALEAMLSIIQYAPETAPVMMDRIFANSDWPDAQVLRKRFERLVPAAAQPPKDGGENFPPEAQQQITQLTQQLEQVTQELQKLQFEAKAKTEEGKARVQATSITAQATVQAESIRQQGEVQRDQAQIAADAQAAAVQAQYDRQLAVLQGQIDAMLTRLDAMVAQRAEHTSEAA